MTAVWTWKSSPSRRSQCVSSRMQPMTRRCCSILAGWARARFTGPANNAIRNYEGALFWGALISFWYDDSAHEHAFSAFLPCTRDSKILDDFEPPLTGVAHKR